MKILFIQSNDARTNSSSNIRNVSLMKCFKEYGHEIYVVMHCSNKPIDESINNTLIHSAKICTIKSNQKNSVFVFENGSNQKKSWKRRLAKYISKYFPYDITFLHNYSIYKNSKFPPKIDVIISSSDPNSSHLLGIKIKKKYPKAVWIQYWGDIMSEDVQYKGSKRILSRIVEKRFIYKADKVVYTNPIVSDYMKTLYPQFAEKISWIPTPFEIHKFTKAISKGKIGYFGSYSSKNRDITNICHIVDELKYPMIVVGAGDIELPRSIEKIPRCSFSELSKYESQCKIIVILENKYIILRNKTKGCLQIPGKLYHYSNSNYYILIICEGDLLKKYYEKYNRFIFCENNTDSILKTLMSIESGNENFTIHEVNEFKAKNIV